MMGGLRIRQEGPRVLLIDAAGRTVADMPARAALDVARAIRQQALRAEEVAEAERIVAEHALLLRVGAPFGLSSDPAIQAEAAKEAAWNSDLRRYLPGGVKSTGELGVPRVITHGVRRLRGLRGHDGS